MKRNIALALCAVCGFAAFAEQLDHWVYDSSAQTISDNVWTISISRWTSKGVSYFQVDSPVAGGYPTDPADPQELNFAKPIQDANDSATLYSITHMNFASASISSSSRGDATPYAWAGCIGRLVFPDSDNCTFTAISNPGAFAWTTNLTEIVNFLPDKISSVGNSAFRYCAAKQPLYLMGVAKATAEFGFSQSKITSVTFGPKLTQIGGGDEYRGYGPFSSSELTAINFDPGMAEGALLSGCKLFNYCTKLTAMPDLSKFTSWGAWEPFYGCGITVDELHVPATVTKFNVCFMAGLHTTKLVFEGVPPTSWSYGYKSATLNNRTVLTTYIPEKYKAEWATYTDGEKEVDTASTTWNSTIAGSSYAKFPLIYEAKAGDLGDWVYDADTHIVTNGVWSFIASNTATQVSVYKWLTYPSTPSALDFTESLTDKNGVTNVFVALRTQFGRDDDRHWVSGTGLSYPTEASGSIASLKFPDTVTTIGSQAFGCCTNLVSVTPLLGDQITALGTAAFANTPIRGDLQLMGLASVTYGSFLKCTNLTSVTFGPKLTSFMSKGDYNNGTFQGCTTLTNVAFDAKMVNGALGIAQNGYGHHFYGCTNLVGTLDLSGFSNLGYTLGTDGVNSMSQVFSGTRYDNVIVATNISRISRNVFLGMSCLTNVTFLGEPPLESTMTVSGFAIYGAMDQKITTSIHKAYRNAWKPYSATGNIYSKYTTWGSDYVADGISLKQRPLVTIETSFPSLQIIVR